MTVRVAPVLSRLISPDPDRTAVRAFPGEFFEFLFFQESSGAESGLLSGRCGLENALAPDRAADRAAWSAWVPALIALQPERVAEGPSAPAGFPEPERRTFSPQT